MIAWKTMNSPTEATTLDNGGAKRRGRKTTKCRMRPSTAANRTEMTRAEMNVWRAPGRSMNVGQFGKSIQSALSRWLLITPSTRASGFGNGGRTIRPLVRSSWNT